MFIPVPTNTNNSSFGGVPESVDINIGNLLDGVKSIDPKAIGISNYQADKDTLAGYTDYMINNWYEKDLHTYMMGVSSNKLVQSNQNTVYFVKLANPTLLWICSWTATRTHIQPIMPNPTVNDPNWILLDEWWKPWPIALANDGITPYYKIAGVFVYGHSNPSIATTDNVKYPIMPWVRQVYVRNIDTTKLDKTIALPVNNSVPIGGITTGQNPTPTPPGPP